MIVLASEDIGNADPRALLVAVAAAQAVEHVGLPEARLNLAQAAIYLARAPKSNASLSALEAATRDVREHGQPAPAGRAARRALPRREEARPGRGLHLSARRPARASTQSTCPRRSVARPTTGRAARARKATATDRDLGYDRAPRVVLLRRFAAIQLAVAAGVVATLAGSTAVTQAAGSDAAPCSPPAQPAWIDYGDKWVPFRHLFFRPGLTVAIAHDAPAADARRRGAQLAFWDMSLKRAVGTPSRPADPRTIPAATARLLEDAVRVTGCSTPIIGLNELFGAQRAAPWRPRNARYRADVLALVQGLAAHGAQPQLFISQAGATGGAAGSWWRAIAQAATIVRELYLPAPSLYALGPGRASVYMRFQLRRAVRNLTTIGIPSSRVGIALGFQAGPGGRMGLAPAPWFQVVKRETLATRQVARELSLASVWSWGWAAFPGTRADPAKRRAACVFLWTREAGLCDGPKVAGPAFRPLPFPARRGEPASDLQAPECPPPGLVPRGRVGQTGCARRLLARASRRPVAQRATPAPRSVPRAAGACAALQRGATSSGCTSRQRTRRGARRSGPPPVLCASIERGGRRPALASLEQAPKRRGGAKMAIERRAHATWEGDLRNGSGRFDLDSGAITGQEVTFTSRFEEPGGKTSPEELIAAAHATCFSMALAGGLAKDGHAPTRLETDAVCTSSRPTPATASPTMHLSVRGEVDGIDEDAFQAAAQAAKEGCPSRTRSAGSRSRSTPPSVSRSRARSCWRPVSPKPPQAPVGMAARSTSYSVRRNSNSPSSPRIAQAARRSPSSGIPGLPGFSSSVPCGPRRRNC